MSVSEPGGGVWRKSSHSGGGNDCVEISVGQARAAVRDSKNPDGPELCFTRSDWTAFLDITRVDRG